MIRHLPPPTEAEEYRNTAQILRDLAAQMRFGNPRSELVTLADNLDRLAAKVEHEACGALDLSPSLAEAWVSKVRPAAIAGGEPERVCPLGRGPTGQARP